MGIEVRTELVIAAPADRVWAALLDTAGWRRWNPVLQALQAAHPGGPPLTADCEPGARLRLTVRAGAREATVRVRLVTLDAPRELTWRGGVPGLFTARHGFTLLPEGAGTRLVHHERFDGVVAWAVARLLRARLRPRHEAMNEALRVEVERSGS